MNKEVVILIAEDDPGHASLIKKNLKRAGISNNIMHFTDGQQVLDYIFQNKSDEDFKSKSYLLLLDIRMPKVDGIEVLRQVKEDKELKKIPVIMITTTDDPKEVNACHKLGCSTYIVKPIDYEQFIRAIRQLGLFLSVVEIPVLKRG
ncbi:MAG: response regulator [Rhodothermaceae bacterium]